MVGGKIIEIVLVEPNKAWVNTVGSGSEHRDTCAIYLDPAGHHLRPGDSLWWQMGNAYWTPQDSITDNNLYDFVLKKLGYSGVSRPERGYHE